MAAYLRRCIDSGMLHFGVDFEGDDGSGDDQLVQVCTEDNAVLVFRPRHAELIAPLNARGVIVAVFGGEDVSKLGRTCPLAKVVDMQKMAFLFGNVHNRATSLEQVFNAVAKFDVYYERPSGYDLHFHFKRGTNGQYVRVNLWQGPIHRHMLVYAAANAYAILYIMRNLGHS